MDLESISVSVIIGVIAAIAGGFSGWLFRGNERKNAVIELAEKVEVKRQQIADDVWKRGISHVDNLFKMHESEVALRTQRIYAEMETREAKILQLRKDFDEFKTEIKKDMEILQTLAFGIDAKSTPPYIKGETASQEHINEPGTGMFYESTPEEQDKQTEENVERQKKEKDEDG